VVILFCEFLLESDAHDGGKSEHFAVMK